MAINGIGDTYLTNYSTTANDIASSRLTSQVQNAESDEAMMDACKQFESYFVEQMFKEMMKTVPETDYSFKSTGTMVDYYRDNMVQEIASLSTESGGLGLAQMLYEQMKINNSL